MNINNENCIYLRDNAKDLKKKIEKLFDFHFLFKHDLSFKRQFSENPNAYLYLRGLVVM